MPQSNLPNTTLERPPKPTEFDWAINDLGGTTVALEATPKFMNASKIFPANRIAAMLEYKTFQNSQLRDQLTYEDKKGRATKTVMDGFETCIKDLQTLVDDYHDSSNNGLDEPYDPCEYY
jgi:hypothetical protein